MIYMTSKTKENKKKAIFYQKKKKLFLYMYFYFYFYLYDLIIRRGCEPDVFIGNTQEVSIEFQNS